MIDLSRHPCPWCESLNPVKGDTDSGISYVECSGCARWVTGQDSTEDSAAAAWIELSEKVHGKPHDGPTVEVRIAVAVDMDGHWWAHGSSIHPKTQAEKMVLDALNPGARLTVITATLPLPVAKEIKGRVGL